MSVQVVIRLSVCLQSQRENIRVKLQCTKPSLQRWMLKTHQHWSGGKMWYGQRSHPSPDSRHTCVVYQDTIYTVQAWMLNATVKGSACFVVLWHGLGATCHFRGRDLWKSKQGCSEWSTSSCDGTFLFWWEVFSRMPPSVGKRAL